MIDEEKGEAGGIYLLDDDATLQAYLDGPLAAGVLSVVIGLAAAYLLDVSPGAMIVLVLFTFFLGAFLFSSRRK